MMTKKESLYDKITYALKKLSRDRFITDWEVRQMDEAGKVYQIRIFSEYNNILVERRILYVEEEAY